MKTLILCHKTIADAGAFTDILVKRGHDVDARLSFNGEIRDIHPDEHELTVFMGGPMGVYQSDIFPYLKDEITYIEKRLSTGKPYLGICLGAQLMAKAMGSEVYPGEHGKEVGWHSIKVNEKGKKCAVRYLDEEYTPMMQWHGDTFDTPKDATLLASSTQYKNQVIAYGKRALGLQCHPEVTENNIEVWLASGYKELNEINMNVPDLRAQTLKNLPILEKQRSLFFNEWLDEVMEK